MEIKNMFRGIIGLAVLGLAAPSVSGAAGYEQLTGELSNAGYRVVGGGPQRVFGVDYAEIDISSQYGFAIYKLCTQVPSLSGNKELCKKQLALLNKTGPFYEKTQDWQPYSIVTNKIKVPLDLGQKLSVMPESDSAASGVDKYILIDIGKGYMGLYLNGQLYKTYPISPGAIGHSTPLQSFRIQDTYPYSIMDARCYQSKTYGGSMPYAMRMFAGYFIHTGVMPGANDSHGCIRMLDENAKELSSLTGTGTPGRIISTRD